MIFKFKVTENFLEKKICSHFSTDSRKSMLTETFAFNKNIKLQASLR